MVVTGSIWVFTAFVLLVVILFLVFVLIFFVMLSGFISTRFLLAFAGYSLVYSLSISG